MKSVAVVTFCVVCVAIVWARPAEEKYEDLAANVDIDEALHNDRLRHNYLTCFKTGEKCTSQAKKVKDIIPDALTTECAKCTDDQKTQSDKVFRYTIKNHPEEFLELEKIYDPKRIYRTKYADNLKKEGLTLPD